MGLFDAIFGRKKRREEEERQARERLAEFERMKREEKENEERKAMLQNKRREEVISEAKALGNNGKIYYILDFYLDCSHWREQNAILEKTPLALPVKRVDVDAEDDVVRKYKVSCLPKLILVDIDGNEIHRWKGTTQSEDINNYLYDNGYACRKLDVEKKPSRDMSIVERAIIRDPEYPIGISYPFYTHKHARGNCTYLTWVCEDCGYTSQFSYRNDMICIDEIYFCEHCRVSQCLNTFYNAPKEVQCVECKRSDKLRKWNGDVCPRCGGKIVQFNAAEIKRKYLNYNMYFVDKNISIFDIIEAKDTEDAAPKPTNSMNRIIASYIKQTYGFELETATAEDLAKVTEILVRDRTMSQEHGQWDFSSFPNLKKIDCSYNPIKLLNISKNHKLESVRFEGARGRIPHKLDFSGNPHLKEVSAGQDGVVELDFSSNHELEKVSVAISNSLRWINIDNCPNLKSIVLYGAIIPFVDLTHCKNLNYVNIHYWNLYQKKYNEFGPGYPRPIIFVSDDFDENVIDGAARMNKHYTYYLIKVKENSIEEKFLQKVKAMKSSILSIPADIDGKGVARMHYELREIYKALETK